MTQCLQRIVESISVTYLLSAKGFNNSPNSCQKIMQSAAVSQKARNTLPTRLDNSVTLIIKMVILFTCDQDWSHMAHHTVIEMLSNYAISFILQLNLCRPSLEALGLCFLDPLNPHLSSNSKSTTAGLQHLWMNLVHPQSPSISDPVTCALEIVSEFSTLSL